MTAARKLDLAQFEGHTPGPWEIEVDNRDGRSRGYIRKAEWAPGQYAIARAMQRNQQYHENAFLLAAAPALLAECKRQREQIAKLRAALRALRGAAVLAEASAFAVPPFVVAMVTYE